MKKQFTRSSIWTILRASPSFYSLTHTHWSGRGERKGQTRPCSTSNINKHTENRTQYSLRNQGISSSFRIKYSKRSTVADVRMGRREEEEQCWAANYCQYQFSDEEQGTGRPYQSMDILTLPHKAFAFLERGKKGANLVEQSLTLPIKRWGPRYREVYLHPQSTFAA